MHKFIVQPKDELNNELTRLFQGRTYGLSYKEILYRFGSFGWPNPRIKRELLLIARNHNCRLRDSKKQRMVRFRKVLSTAGVRTAQTTMPFKARRKRTHEIR
jgi:hypothetical protein